MTQPVSGQKQELKVKFWGVRGTRMVSDCNEVIYGQNTICVEVQCGDRILVFDAGSGIIQLGNDLIDRGITSMDLFLSHAHYDHVEGIPFFQPFYNQNFTTHFWAGRLNGIRHTRDIVDGLMKEPYFPIKQEKFLSTIHYREIQDYQTIDLGGGIKVETTRLMHPGGATGYKVLFDGRSFAFVTDTTHAIDQQDQTLLDFVRDVDLFAYDCSYLDVEFPKFASFGHSTWEEGARLKAKSGAKAMMGFHHMPYRSDDELDAIAKMLEKECPGCRVAKDHDTIIL